MIKDGGLQRREGGRTRMTHDRDPGVSDRPRRMPAMGPLKVLFRPPCHLFRAVRMAFGPLLCEMKQQKTACDTLTSTFSPVYQDAEMLAEVR